MLATSRPFISAGVAVVGAGAIAISPAVLPQPTMHAQAAVQLAATTWQEVFAEASQNATALYDEWRAAPAPILQQITANQQKYLSELPDLATVAAQIQANAASALAAFTKPDLSTLDTTHRTLYQLLPAVLQLPGIPDALHFSISEMGQQLLGFSTTALSGVVLGMAGPILGPLLVLQSSLDSISDDVTGSNPDMTAALNTLAGIPAAMADAFLSGGQHIDLTSLVTAIGPSLGVTFPAGVTVGIALGGLLSPGGSIFNALDLAYDSNVLGLPVHVGLATGTGVGPIGAMMDLARAIAKAIGWNGATSAAAAANEVPRSALTAAASVTAPITVATKSAAQSEPAAGSATDSPRDAASNSLSDKTVRAAAGSSARTQATNRVAVGANRAATSAAASDHASATASGKAGTARSKRAAAGS
ncbi:outer membrane porin GjpA [Mycolicibacterium sp. CBM1]